MLFVPLSRYPDKHIIDAFRRQGVLCAHSKRLSPFRKPEQF